MILIRRLEVVGEPMGQNDCHKFERALENVALFLRCFEGLEGKEGHQGNLIASR
jgi:hypothetical protein